VISDTLLGLVAFAATAGPGYLFVRLAERREPRHDRSPLQEAAELILVGGLATAAGLLVSLALWEALGLVHSGTLGDDVGQYLLAHPARSLVVLATALAVSYSAVWVLARLLLGTAEDIRPSDSAWYAAFRRQAPEGYGVLVTLTMRDGRAFTGALSSFTVPPEKEREILLNAPANRPIYLQDSNGVHEMTDAFIIIQSSEILFLSGVYEAAVALR
jgi:uncharacterized protein DUF6338